MTHPICGKLQHDNRTPVASQQTAGEASDRFYSPKYVIDHLCLASNKYAPTACAALLRGTSNQDDDLCTSEGC